MTFGIQNFFNESSAVLSTEEGKTFCNNLLTSVNQRLTPYEVRSVPRLGTILDPRFKKEGFRNKENASAATAILEHDMFILSHKIQENRRSPDSADNSKKPATTSSVLFGFLQEKIDEKVKSVIADIIITKRQYLERQNAAENTHSLLFWKVTGNELIPLNELSRKYFCVSATSVESEKIFSSTGHLVTERRSRLKPNNVNMLTFLHKSFANSVSDK